MSIWEYLVLAPVSLFVIINPVSAVPVFLAITPGDTPADRVRTAKLACIVGTVLLLAFALVGQFVFRVMGITLPAFQIAGGILLFAIAFEMLRSPDVQTRLTEEEESLAAKKEDVAITPLAVPLLCGPGAITTTIILQSQAETAAHNAVLIAAIPSVYFIAFVLLKWAAHGGSRINPIVLRVLRRLMGLLFSAVAVQFIINGISNLDLLQR
ncbi:MAG: NAAT family transporter [Puniceicoccaceae bacterium]|nr:MAG: NAAT family transporter [Puniceicoccaceae bacterium]